MSSPLKMTKKKLLAWLLTFVLASCNSETEKKKIALLSKDESRSIAERHHRRIDNNSTINHQDWRIDFLNDKWIYSSNKPALALYGGVHIILDARTGEILQPISKQEVRKIAQAAIKKHYPNIVFSNINWEIMLYQGKWIIGPKTEGLGGGVTVDIDAITGEVLKVYFTE